MGTTDRTPKKLLVDLPAPSREKKMLGGLVTLRSDEIKNEKPAIKMLPGFIASVRIRCGKSNCRCAGGSRHIAHYHVGYIQGRRFRRYVRRVDVAATLSACQAYKRLQAQLRDGRKEYKRDLANIRELIRIIRNE